MLTFTNKETEEFEFDKCFIDGDSMLYRIAYTTNSDAQAASTFDLALLAVMRDTGSAKGYVAVKDRLANLYQYCWDTGCVQSDNCEADDVVSIWGTEADVEGCSWVVAHVDKDIDMVPGWHYNFNKKTLYHTDADQGHYLLCKQLLTGDASDNIKGIRGIGPKTAEKLLKDVPAEGMLDVVRKSWRDKHPREWKEKLQLCFNLIYMRRSFDDFREMTIEEVYGEGNLR